MHYITYLVWKMDGGITMRLTPKGTESEDKAESRKKALESLKIILGVEDTSKIIPHLRSKKRY